MTSNAPPTESLKPTEPLKSLPATGWRSRPVQIILAVSALVVAFIFWWIFFKTTATPTASWIDALPAANAVFNTLCALCLVAGFRAIRRKDPETHKRFMLTAVGFSALFFISYLTYHHYHGDTPFPGQGWVRPLYFFILISHILLSIAVIPMAITTLFYAGKKKHRSHKRIARWTLPVWLYVSITGVAIFLFLSAYT